MALSEQFNSFLDRPNISHHTRNKYFYRLRQFISLHAQKRANEITTTMILDYINAQTKLSDASKAILRQCFHAFLAFCEVDPNPAGQLPHWRETPRYIAVPKDSEVSRVFDTAVLQMETGKPIPLRNGLIFTLAIVSGNRRGELRNLTINALLHCLNSELTQDVYHVYTTGKTGEAILRFTSFHVPYIHNYLQIRPETPETAVFVNLNKTHANYGQKLSLTAYDRIRRSLCTKAGCESITYQELRRRLATKIARAHGVDVAAHALNHSPHSGDRVIRAYYYDPDKEAVDRAVMDAFKVTG